MPKEVEAKLHAQARSKGLTGDRKDAYVFGTLQKMEGKGSSGSGKGGGGRRK